MRLIDADCLMDHAGRDRIDSRELVLKMIEDAPTYDTKPFYMEGYKQAQKDFEVVKKNLQSAWDSERVINMQINERIDMQESIIKMFIKELILALRNGN